MQLYRLLLTGTPLQNNLHELRAVFHVLLSDYFTSADAFDEAVDVASHRVDAERLESARQLLGHLMLRRTEEVVGLPRKYETLVPCPLAPLQASWYKRLLSSDTATASVLTVSQLKTLIMQLRKICNHPRTLLGSAKDTAAAAAAGAAAAAAVSSSSSSKTPMGGGGKRGERLRQELAALTGEELMQASGKLLVLDRLLERLFKLESRALIFSTFTQVMAAADGHLMVGTDCHLLAASDGPRIAPLHASAHHGALGSLPCMQVLSTAPSPRLSSQVQMGDTRR